MATVADVGRFLANRPPARPNAPPDPWGLIERAIAGASRPTRPRLSEALRVAAARPDNLWEALLVAGLIPWDWASDRSRGFVTPRGFVTGVYMGPEKPPFHKVARSDSWSRVHADEVSPLLRAGDLASMWGNDHIPSVHDAPELDDAETAVVMAADVENVLRVEDLAREAADRLVFWGALPVTRVAWQVAESDDFVPQSPDTSYATLTQDLHGSYTESDDERHWLNTYLSEWNARRARLERLRFMCLDHVRWAGAVREERASLRAECFGRLRNPIEPLLEIAALGYFAKSPEHGTFRLLAPGLAEGGTGR